MAFSKQQTLSIYGIVYLPLAVLSAIAVSVFLPAAPIILLPAMDSSLFISLPQLWRAFLSWITPPCLFVLLNGIIVILTATSGALSNPKSDSESDFYASLLGKMENSYKASSGRLMADPVACDAYTHKNLKMKIMHGQRSATAMVASHRPVLSQGELQVPPEAGIVDAQKPCVFYNAHGVYETKQGKIFDKGEDDDDDENPSDLSRLTMGSRSFPHVCSETRTLEEEKEEEREQEESDERISGLPKLAVMSFSFGCRSEPSSPQFTTPLKGNTIKRSLSVDSAAFHDNQASSCSQEELSDEAFRKRVEDFISRKNAQWRSEAK